MQNKITDLNNHLFSQLERLSDEEITPEELEKEIQRSKAVTAVAGTIIESARVTVDAMKIMRDSGADIGQIGKDHLFHQIDKK